MKVDATGSCRRAESSLLGITLERSNSDLIFFTTISSLKLQFSALLGAFAEAIGDLAVTSRRDERVARALDRFFMVFDPGLDDGELVTCTGAREIVDHLQAYIVTDCSVPLFERCQQPVAQPLLVVERHEMLRECFAGVVFSELAIS